MESRFELEQRGAAIQRITRVKCRMIMSSGRGGLTTCKFERTIVASRQWEMAVTDRNRYETRRK
jgi:hypothetical protein